MLKRTEEQTVLCQKLQQPPCVRICAGPNAATFYFHGAVYEL